MSSQLISYDKEDEKVRFAFGRDMKFSTEEAVEKFEQGDDTLTINKKDILTAERFSKVVKGINFNLPKTTDYT